MQVRLKGYDSVIRPAVGLVLVVEVGLLRDPSRKIGSIFGYRTLKIFPSF